MSDIKQQLIEAAQTLIQKRGYNGFSYRDIAEEVGIRSASIHYHFPSKADLGAAAAQAYTQNFMDQLNEVAGNTLRPAEQLATFAALFRQTLSQDGKMCLCGILGAEVASLPPDVALQAKRFFERALGWLSGVMARRTDGGPDDARKDAAEFLALLEGAMILAKGLADPAILDDLIESAIARAI